MRCNIALPGWLKCSAWLSLALACSLAFGCGRSRLPGTSSAGAGLLEACGISAECPEGLQCLCGVCATECASDRECGIWGSNAVCANAADTSMKAGCSEHQIAGEIAMCAIPCRQYLDCKGVSTVELVCYDRFCADATNALRWAEREKMDSGWLRDAGSPTDAGRDSSGPADSGADSEAAERACAAPGSCPPIGIWLGDPSCEAAATNRSACGAGGACDEGVCHFDDSCIEPGRCDDNGVATLAVADGLVSKVAVDERFVYWADFGRVDAGGVYLGGGKIARVAISGGASSIIADNLNKPGDLFIDAQHAYWTETDTSGDVVLWRALKEGSSSPERLLGPGKWYGLQQDRENIYYLSGKYAYSLSKQSGAAPIRLAAGRYGLSGAIAVGIDEIYTLSANPYELIIAPKDSAQPAREVVFYTRLCPGVSAMAFGDRRVYCGYNESWRLVEALSLEGENPALFSIRLSTTRTFPRPTTAA